MMAHALRQEEEATQLGLYERPGLPAPHPANRNNGPRMCAACRAHEARYGFRDSEDDDPLLGRSRTLCFECFRIEVDRRQAVAAQRLRGWNATQVDLPLASKLDALRLRRRRAQIAARHALGER